MFTEFPSRKNILLLHVVSVVRQSTAKSVATWQPCTIVMRSPYCLSATIVIFETCRIFRYRIFLCYVQVWWPSAITAMDFLGTKDSSRTVESYARSAVQKWFNAHRKLHSWRVCSATNYSFCNNVIAVISYITISSEEVNVSFPVSSYYICFCFICLSNKWDPSTFIGKLFRKL
jgi:hypothetical protein